MSRTTGHTLAVLGIAALLLPGCGKEPPPPAPPPPPPGATVEQLRIVAEAAERVRKEEETLEARVTELEGKVAELKKARAEDAEQRRLQEDAPVPPAPPEVPARLKGQVLAADSAMDIYLISIGRKDGVKVGDELTVFRGDSFVAQVVVDKLFEDKASVVVKKIQDKPMKKSEIKTGDKVASTL